MPTTTTEPGHRCVAFGCPAFVPSQDQLCFHCSASNDIVGSSVEAMSQRLEKQAQEIKTKIAEEQRKLIEDISRVRDEPLGTGIEATLAERGKRYGEFKDHAVIAQGLQDTMRAAPGWQRLAPDQKQSLTTICDKIARMLNGDPDYLDNWHDIIGYAKLVEDRLKSEQK